MGGIIPGMMKCDDRGIEGPSGALRGRNRPSQSCKIHASSGEDGRPRMRRLMQWIGRVLTCGDDQRSVWWRSRSEQKGAPRMLADAAPRITDRQTPISCFHARHHSLRHRPRPGQDAARDSSLPIPTSLLTHCDAARIHRRILRSAAQMGSDCVSLAGICPATRSIQTPARISAVPRSSSAANPPNPTLPPVFYASHRGPKDRVAPRAVLRLRPSRAANVPATRSTDPVRMRCCATASCSRSLLASRQQHSPHDDAGSPPPSPFFRMRQYEASS